MRFTYRPLTPGGWEGPHTPNDQRRSRQTFKAGWADTMNLLDRELWYLGAENFVIEADFREQDIRLDGLPKANARQPDFPGIRLAFDSDHGPLIYQTDTCVYWQHNVRSIALGLEALRAVDRYGITHRAEQYTGFKAIAAPVQLFNTVDDAVNWLVDPDTIGFVGARGVELPKVLKIVARRYHPDNGGDPQMWAKYDKAAQMVKKAGLV